MEADQNIITIRDPHSNLGLLVMEENNSAIYGLFKALFLFWHFNCALVILLNLRMKKNRQDISKIYHFQVLTVKAKHITVCEPMFYLGQIKDRKCIL